MNKTFEGYLLLNWKTGRIKIMKRKRRAGPFDVVVHFRIELELPEPKEHEISGRIIIPKEKVAEMVFEALRE